MKPEFGDPYILEEYTLDDLKQHPILVWAVHEAVDPEMKYLTPLLNTSNLTGEFNHAKILLTVKGSDTFVEASYNLLDRSVYSILVWEEGSAVEMEDSDLEIPLILQAVPDIEGDANVEFVLESKEDYYAYRNE